MTRRRLSQNTIGRIRAIAGDRCGYCLTPQSYAMHVLEIEHIVPRAAGGTDNEDSLWLACRLCNNAKGVKGLATIPLLNGASRSSIRESKGGVVTSIWSADGTKVIGRTICGRATVEALKLNNEIALVVRQNWVTAGWHPPLA